MRRATAYGIFALLALGGVLAPACAPNSDTNPGGSGGTGTGGASTTTTTSTGGDMPDGICLLHNCNSDLECATCDGGRTHCLTAEHRCVACGANTTSGCPDGFECSSFGACVPKGATCPTNNGTPTITCNTSADCVACDPAHQVCDSTTHQCVACTANDTSECQSTDLCKNGQCSPKCPSSCQTDNDCGLCGTSNNKAHACNAHNCAECSPTYACPAGKVCDPHGTCQTRCGLEGPVEGTCDVDADCNGCGGGATHCHTPINGGHGTCGPEAAGCSDLGNGTITLPSPFDKVTNTCSHDADCSGVGVTYNVGKALRDLTGFEQIHDADISYPMNVCAAVSIGPVSCGICVPCKVDSDCMPLDIDQVAGDALGPLGTVGAALLLDEIFGPNDHKIHMYCQTVAAGYGVCAPCPGVLSDCTTGGGGSGTGTCDHDACTEGGALNTSCGTCEANVCGQDSYCCDTSWDSTCVSEADQYCNGICTSPGGSCGHDECTSGESLSDSCTGCTAQLCAQDAYCCQTAWDSQCVSEATSICGKSCP